MLLSNQVQPASRQQITREKRGRLTEGFIPAPSIPSRPIIAQAVEPVMYGLSSFRALFSINPIKIKQQQQHLLVAIHCFSLERRTRRQQLRLLASSIDQPWLLLFSYVI